MSETTNHSNFAFDSLESIRKKLLDLTTRNSLLSYRFPKSSSLRFIDELPDQIVSVLQEGKALTFVPVPEPRESELIEAGYSTIDEESGNTIIPEYPTAEEWAKHLGFATSYDLPENNPNETHDKHSDNNIQTLLYRPELEARLRNLMSRARTAIEESGVNILFLNIGYLNWYESRTSDLPRSAPLYSIPVKLERNKLDSKQGVYEYKISVVDDSLLPNLTLSEKLAIDFGLALPEVTDDIKPDAYLKLVESKISSNQPRWKVRRQANLSLLNFAKQVIYEDLDPNNWPEDAKIEELPNIRMFFESIESDTDVGANTYLPEHDIDALQDVHENYPIVFKADSSQHSALIDAIEGKNLVIEGPPGTGKSQTIANLIAASISNNKKVLFVAEKMAALEVVKSRLESVGLGDFCLELHSHKANKPEVLRSLEARLKKTEDYDRPNITDEIARFESLKQKLTEYVEFINSPWKSTGLTAHQILNRATRLREETRIDPNRLAITELNGDWFDSAKRLELFDRAKILASVFRQISEQAPDGNVTRHYWYGINSHQMLDHEISECFNSLEEWTESLSALGQVWREFNDNIHVKDLSVVASYTECLKTFSALTNLPNLNGGEPLSELGYVANNLEEFEKFLKGYLAIHKLANQAKKDVTVSAINDPTSPSNWQSAIATLTDLGVNPSFSIQSLESNIGYATEAKTKADTVGRSFAEMRSQLPPGLTTIVEPTLKGLNEFQTAISVIEQIPVELMRFRAPEFENEEADDYLRTLEPLLEVFRKAHDDVIDVYALHRVPDLQSLKQHAEVFDQTPVFKRFGKTFRASKKAILEISASKNIKKKMLMSQLDRLIDYQESVEKIAALNKQFDDLSQLYDGIETPLDRHKKIRNWYKVVFTEYGRGFGERSQIGRAVIELDRNLARSMLEFMNQGLGDDIRSLEQLSELLGTSFPKAQGFRSPTDTFQSPSPAEMLLSQLTVVKVQLTGLSSTAASIKDIAQQSDLLRRFNHLKSGWLASSCTKHLVPDHFSLSPTTGEYNESALRSAVNMLKIAKLVATNQGIGEFLRDENPARYDELLAMRDNSQNVINRESTARTRFEKGTSVNLQQWMEPTSGRFEVIEGKNTKALAQKAWLTTWQDYQAVRARLVEDGLDAILESLEAQDIAADALIDVVELVAMHQLATEMMQESPLLRTFSGLEQNAIRERFREYDQSIQKLQCAQVAFSASRTPPETGVSTGRVANFTEASLILHEAGKKKRHIAIRNLMERAQKTIQAIKPCFMMSPMSVAQYLPQGAYNFDLVVMDEASQIRPEDAIGSIARGSTLVVVGDPKQLPPTSFFQKVIDDEDDSESVALEESESILESAIPMFRNRRLRWHYRSRHESLIAFSNQQFYDSNLVLFPSPFQESKDLGIRMRFVSRGRFANRRNVQEARQVVAHVCQHLLNSDESIAVVVMNSEQRDEVERQLELAIKEDQSLRRAYDKDGERSDSLIVKNLENIQGDERDVVVISMTYGPEQVGGRVMQRFGPINRDTGWRRLNVLLTRAKKRMQVFTSMRSTDILTDAKSSRGLRALKGFLEYCETGNLVAPIHTGLSPDSDFEVAVINALKAHGYDCEPQLGVAGFYLDIAVRDPGKPGSFLMGIECDGASYHSAKSARDRDVLRQDILESLGWKIRRIWSTDWFKNPEAQLHPIIAELETLKSQIVVEASEIADDPEDQIEQQKTVEFGSDQTLKERLLELDQLVIRVASPDTTEDNRLLRPAMLEALLSHLPCSKAEFLEVIPQYLREGTSPAEGKHLDRVLQVISEYA